MLDLQSQTSGDITILRLRGRLVGERPTTTLDQHCRTLLKEGRLKIVLNLSGVPMIDSNGLGELVALSSAAKKQGGAVRLAAPTEMVSEVLRMTRLLDVIETHPDEASAIASFSTAQS